VDGGQVFCRLSAAKQSKAKQSKAKQSKANNNVEHEAINKDGTNLLQSDCTAAPFGHLGLIVNCQKTVVYPKFAQSLSWKVMMSITGSEGIL
jgi:hypothetical protein